MGIYFMMNNVDEQIVFQYQMDMTYMVHGFILKYSSNAGKLLECWKAAILEGCWRIYKAKRNANTLLESLLSDKSSHGFSLYT